MRNGDEDNRIPGRRPQVPNPRPDNANSPTISDTHTQDNEAGIRENDTGAGRRPQVPSQMHALTQTEIREYASRRDKTSFTVDEIDRQLFGKQSRKRTVFFITLLGFCTALLSIFLLHSFATTWRMLIEFPRVVSYPLLLLFLVCIAIVATVIIALWWRYITLPPAGRTLLWKRNALSRGAPADAHAVYRRAKEHILSGFITPYDRHFSRVKELLNTWDIEPSLQDSLQRAVRKLSVDDGTMTHDEWIQYYRDNVHTRLQEIAKARAWYYAKIVGLKTAISPFALLDMLAVLGNAAVMTDDLMRLYLRRPRWGQHVFLLLHVVVQTYVAGQAQELMEGTMSEIGIGLENTLLKSIGTKVVSRVAEGGVNGVFMYHLGIRINAYLAPIDG